MIIVIFGPPGAGKGTQSELIASEFGLKKISTGDLLREEIKKDSNLGKKIKLIIDQGQFTSDNLINDLIKNVLYKDKKNNQIIFDGYPRNANQAETLDDLLSKIEQNLKLALNLEVNKEILFKRVTGRSFCSKCKKTFNDFFDPPNKNHKCESKFLKRRSDDTRQVFETRLNAYFENTLPILNFYEKKNILHKISGDGDISLIYKQISDIIRRL